jgi:hypothetical protein
MGLTREPAGPGCSPSSLRRLVQLKQKGKTMSEENQSKKPDLVAYQVSQVGDKAYYHRIGAAWSNSKGGAKVKLEAFPVNGEILLMPPREREEDAPS